jgi:hypothetical protein
MVEQDFVNFEGRECFRSFSDFMSGKINLVGISKSVSFYCAYKLSGMCIIIIYRCDCSHYVRKESMNNKYFREFVVQEEKSWELYLLIIIQNLLTPFKTTKASKIEVEVPV